MNHKPRKVLLLGSGAIKIGEAGEFDYSGAQALKAMKEEGIRTILVNPNIATIQSDRKYVDRAYFLPVKAEHIEGVIAKEKPDGILLTFGGQTALNAGMELHERGVLKKYGVSVLGTGIFSIEACDDRDMFRRVMEGNGLPVPKSMKASSVGEALEIAGRLGYPVMVRTAYALGGLGSGIARDAAQLSQIAGRGLVCSRIHEVLVEEYIGGWKEFEYEVMRDSEDNCAIVCNIENMDPVGIHTGESIVVAPSQTLTNREYHVLRTAAFKAIRALKIVGECNIQFAVQPESGEYRVIEVNSRLSRSSALASKATGYPIAYVAAKLSLGYTLPELVNKVTGATTACFEPALDYVVVKIPRWDLQKFRRASRKIGTQMKSVGEVMAVGRCFEEALQKAVRMLDIGRELTDFKSLETDPTVVKEMLQNPTDQRLFYIAKALRSGMGSEEVCGLTAIDPWFIRKIGAIVEYEEAIRSGGLQPVTLKAAKQMGFSDKKIGELLGKGEAQVREARKALGIVPVVKQIDTLAAEWPAATNYLYMTYNGETDDIGFTKGKKAVVLGSGCYRIGSSVEFDWCCVNMGLALKRYMDEVIMVNCNPETVSTDYDTLDKLYFEEITLERVLDIADKEQPFGVVVSVGGQTPNNLAMSLSGHGVNVLGTDVECIDRAEDRKKFSEVLDELGIRQPPWKQLSSIKKAKEFAREIGYPVLVRPSYVLSGSAMNVAFDDRHLEQSLRLATEVSKDQPVVVTKFMTSAKEVDIDGVCDGRNVFIGSIIEHIENAGRHSGDATMSIPPLTLDSATKRVLRDYTRRIAIGLRIRGPFNIQYMVKNGVVYVIETNLRASRSMPFVSKSIGVNLMSLAADAMLGKAIRPGEGTAKKFGVKSPQFSFLPIEGADPVCGVEMDSTGEVACFGELFENALLSSLMASGISPPRAGGGVLLSIGRDKWRVIPIAEKLIRNGFSLYATTKTARAVRSCGLRCKTLYKVSEDKAPNILEYLDQRKLDMVINIAQLNGDNPKQKFQDGYAIRRKAIESGIPVVTNVELAEAMLDSIENVGAKGSSLRSATNDPGRGVSVEKSEAKEAKGGAA
jgi:carbamoyl-phosphate synthase large subunit